MAEMNIDEAVKTLEEWLAEQGRHPPMRSPYEAISVLLAEIEDCRRDHPLEPWASELKAEVERLKEEGEDTNTAFEFANETIGKLEAEVERLKRTLDWIAYGCDVGPEHEAYYACVEKAEKALKGEKENERQQKPKRKPCPVCGRYHYSGDYPCPPSEALKGEK